MTPTPSTKQHRMYSPLCTSTGLYPVAGGAVAAVPGRRGGSGGSEGITLRRRGQQTRLHTGTGDFAFCRQNLRIGYFSIETLGPWTSRDALGLMCSCHCVDGQLSSIIRLEQRVEELMAELQEEKDEGRRRERENAALQKIARVRGQRCDLTTPCVEYVGGAARSASRWNGLFTVHSCLLACGGCVNAGRECGAGRGTGTPQSPRRKQ